MPRDPLLHRSRDEVLVLATGLMATHRGLSTAAGQLRTLDLLQPLWRAAMEDVLGARVLHVDASGLPVLSDSRPGSPTLGWLWSYVGDEQTALYLYTPQAQQQDEPSADDLLSRRHGYVVVSGSSRSPTAPPRQGLIECGCNLQARRYFIQARENGDSSLANPLGVFQLLYTVEDELQGRPPELKRAMRQQVSRPAYDDLMNWCIQRGPKESPTSLLGRAIRYMLDHQVALRRFLDDGVIPIDNGIFERLPAHMMLSSHRHLLASSDAGAHCAAAVLTVLSCCELAGVEPIEYLVDVLPRLDRSTSPAEAAALLPARWKMLF